MRLKNLAVHWLLSKGFEPGDIEQERFIGEPGNGGYTDIYAGNGSREVFIECEAGRFPNPSHLSRGGGIPLRNGEAVFVFRPDGIYVLDHEVRTYTDKHTGEEAERRVRVMNWHENLPMIDLRVFNSD